RSAAPPRDGAASPGCDLPVCEAQADQSTPRPTSVMPRIRGTPSPQPPPRGRGKLLAFEQGWVDRLLRAAVVVLAHLGRLGRLGGDLVEHGHAICLVVQLVEVALADVDQLARLEDDVLAFLHAAKMQLTLEY